MNTWKEKEPDIFIIGAFDDNLSAELSEIGYDSLSENDYELYITVQEQMPWRMDWYEVMEYKIYVKKDLGGEK